MAEKVLDFIRGSDLNLYFTIAGVSWVVGHSTDCSIKVTADVQETTTKNTLKGKTYDYTNKYSYTLTLAEFTSFLDVPNLSVFQDAIMQATKLLFVFTDQFSIQWSGTVLINDSETDSPFAAISSTNITLQGDGELVKVTTNIPPIPLPTETVQIIDQFGNVIATVVAPGSYAVLRFNRIEQGHAVRNDPQLIIMSGQ